MLLSVKERVAKHYGYVNLLLSVCFAIKPFIHFSFTQNVWRLTVH